MPKKPQEAVAWPEFVRAQDRWRQQLNTSSETSVDQRAILADYRRAARALARELRLI